MQLHNTNIIQRLSQLDEQERKSAIEKSLLLNKAMHSQDIDTIYKAQQYYTSLTTRNQKYTSSVREDGMKSIVMDPFDLSSSMGYYYKNSALSYSTLRAMSRAPIPRAVIKTRKDQVAEFAKVQPDKYSKGFVLEKVGIADEDELSDADKKYRDQLYAFLLNCGDEQHRWRWDKFETFLRKITEDSLVLDQATFEVIPYRTLEPAMFVAVDGELFRIADSYDDSKDSDKKKIYGYTPSYVQVYQGQILADFYPWELCFGIRNPSTNIRQNGYGRSELEDLVGNVTSQLHGDQYNANFFKKGSAPKGALLVKKGNLNPDRLQELRRDWNNFMGGVENSWKTPVLDAEAVEWLDFQKTNRDMEFSKFQEYLIKVFCAHYTISPEEIGFPLEGTNRGGIGGKDNGKEEKQYSQDKGLKPLLTTFASWINDFIIGPKTNFKWIFKFVGLDAESAEAEEKRITEAVKSYMTVNEARKLRGLKKIEGGDIILDSNFVQLQVNKMQNEMQMSQQQSAKDDENYTNTNPFLDNEEDKDNPFTKGLELWWDKEMAYA